MSDSQDKWAEMFEALPVDPSSTKHQQTQTKRQALERFSEQLRGFKKGKNVLTGNEIMLQNKIQLPPKSPIILVLE